MADTVHFWVENYLFRARGHRALEQSILAAGERRGFSERALRRACARLDASLDAGCWELDPGRVAELTRREIAALRAVPAQPRSSFEPRFGTGDTG